VLDLTIPRQILDEMIAHARAAAPHECCGLLAGKDGRVTRHYRIKNVVAMKEDGVKELFDGAKITTLEQMTPEERADVAFWMDTKDMFAAQKDMRADNIALLASYHSHPISPARPSPTDIKALALYPDIYHIIISLQDSKTPVVNAFRIGGETVESVAYQTTS
jgi:proteasome lid subunit RPN8/RPN11